MSTCGAQPDVETAEAAPIVNQPLFYDFVDPNGANGLRVSQFCFFHVRRCGAQPHRGGVKQYFCRAGEGATWAQGKHVCILCLALLVHPKHKLPTEDFEGLEDLANFEGVVEKRCNDVGRPLTALSQEEITRGYLSVVDKGVIPNRGAHAVTD